MQCPVCPLPRAVLRTRTDRIVPNPSRTHARACARLNRIVFFAYHSHHNARGTSCRVNVSDSTCNQQYDSTVPRRRRGSRPYPVEDRLHVTPEIRWSTIHSSSKERASERKGKKKKNSPISPRSLRQPRLVRSATANRQTWSRPLSRVSSFNFPGYHRAVLGSGKLSSMRNVAEIVTRVLYDAKKKGKNSKKRKKEINDK